MQEVESRALELALAVSKKIVDTAVEINPEYLLSILKKGLELGVADKIKKIRVSPQDLEFIDLMGLRKNLKKAEDTWEFKADSSVSAGCILETDAGEIDFDLNAAWERLADKIVSISKS